MKMKKLYQVREFTDSSSYSRALGHNLRTYKSAIAIKNLLKKGKRNIFLVPMAINCSSKGRGWSKI